MAEPSVARGRQAWFPVRRPRTRWRNPLTPALTLRAPKRKGSGTRAP